MKRIRSEQNRAPGSGDTARGQMLAATSAFLVLAILFLYGFVHLLRLAVRRALAPPDPAAAIQATIVPETGTVQEPFPVFEEPAVQADARPDPGAAGNPEAEAAACGVGTPGVTPIGATPLPECSPIAIQRAKAEFSRSRMDLVLLGFDGAGQLDLAALMALRPDRCTLFFLPENLIDHSGLPLNRLSDCDDVLQALETVLPLDLHHYVYLQTDRIGDCMDALGSAAANGDLPDGAAAQRLCEDDGSDPMIRLERIRPLMKDAVSSLGGIGLLRLGSVKQTLLDAGGGSPAKEEYLALYLGLRGLKQEQIQTCLLPVDSLTVDGERCYRLDLPRAVEQLKTCYPF